MEFRESPTEKRAKEKATPVVEAEVVEAKPKAKPKTKTQAKAKPKTVKQTTKTTTPAKSRSLNAEMAVYYLTGLVEILLGVRLILAISDPNGSGGLIYGVVDPLTRPFYDLFYTTGGHEPDASIILLSMLVYGLFGWGLGRLLRPSSKRG